VSTNTQKIYRDFIYEFSSFSRLFIVHIAISLIQPQLKVKRRGQSHAFSVGIKPYLYLAASGQAGNGATLVPRP
jgi:hypothetical protein